MSSFSLNIANLKNGTDDGVVNKVGNEKIMTGIDERSISPINIIHSNPSRSISSASIVQSPPETQTQESNDSRLGRKVIRTRTGCLTCRRRKKKCDEQRCPDTGGCTRCKQAGYQCEGFPQLLQIENTGKVIKANGNRKRSSFYEPNNQKRKSTTTNSDRSILSISPPEQHEHLHMHATQNRFGDSMNGEDAHGLFALQAAATSLMESSPNRPEESMHDQFAPSSFESHLSIGHHNNSNPLRHRTSSISSRIADPIILQPMQIDSNNQMIMTTTNVSSSGQTPSRYVQMHNDSSPGQGSNVNNYVGGSVCTFIGECILIGRQICTSCLSTIEPLFSPSDPTPNFQLPTPTSSVGASSIETRHQPVMQSLIGYYSAVVTCWIEGCFPQQIANSTFFRDLVHYLLSNIDENEALRLSVAAVASGYIGGGQLQWPEDLIAIKRWTNTLRQDTTELVDVTVSMTGQSTANKRDLENANGPDKLARHTYIDRHLSKHAMVFYRMAKRAVEDAIQRASREPNHHYGMNGTRPTNANDINSTYVDPYLAKKYNSILVATVNLCVFSWAEMSIETYYEDFDMVLQAAHTLFGGIRRVKLAYLNSLDTIGLAIVCWADTCASIARGTRPYFELDESPLNEEEKQILINCPNAAKQFAFHSFNCPSALFQCLNDLARLRFDCKAAPQRGWNGGNTEGGRQSSPLPAFLGHRAAQLDARLKALSVQTQHTLDPSGNQIALTRPDGTSLNHFGSPNCSEMTRLASVLILYTGIYQKGPLHPTCKFALQSIIHLWTYGASGFCKDVGCSNYLLPVFMASVVACETRDRLLLEEAMNIVGHNEAVADASRQAVKEIWKRTDEDGFPALWTDVVRPGLMTVAFL